VGEVIEDAPVGHQDGLGITGTFTEAAAHDAQKGLHHFNFAIFGGLKHLFGAHFNALHPAVAQIS
jgi:hypothetical protein